MSFISWSRQFLKINFSICIAIEMSIKIYNLSIVVYLKHGTSTRTNYTFRFNVISIAL